jgi:biotin carboxyl carrier protein
MELESFCSGKISKILVKEGDVVETGQTIAIVK